MSESDEGVSVAATRQNAGRSLKFGAAPRPAVGSVKPPCTTICASVTRPPPSRNDVRPSQGMAAVAAGADGDDCIAQPESTAPATNAMLFMIKLPGRVYRRRGRMSGREAL